MTELPFTTEIQGLVFTFERRPCPKNMYEQLTCRAYPFFMGRSNLDRGRSRRVGMCKHVVFDLATWMASMDVQMHIEGLGNDRRRESDREAIQEELHPRPGDAVYEAHRSERPSGYVVKVAGLTRAQAVQVYKMVETIRGEFADAGLEES